MSDLYRKPAKPLWLIMPPPPEVTNREPKPDDAPDVPKSVLALAKLAEAGGWEARIGYSRAVKRGQKTGSYRPIEVFGVWLGGGHPSGWRASALYERFRDAKQEDTHYEDGSWRRTVEPVGKPGTWSWECRLFSVKGRHEVSVTNLKEFMSVRGSVLPSWFEAKTIRPKVADEEQEQE